MYAVMRRQMQSELLIRHRDTRIVELRHEGEGQRRDTYTETFYSVSHTVKCTVSATNSIPSSTGSF